MFHGVGGRAGHYIGFSCTTCGGGVFALGIFTSKA